MVLPVELQLMIVEQLDDVFEYMRLARVCKGFQKLIRSMVLLVSDSSNKSNLFNSIATRHINLTPGHIRQGVRDDLQKTFKKFQYFIFEYSCINPLTLAGYIRLIADLKSKDSEKIDIVYITGVGARESKNLMFVNPSAIMIHKIDQVSKSIFVNGSDLALVNTQHYNHRHEHGHNHDIDSLVVMGHTHYFDTIVHAPQFYVFAHQRYKFKIIAPRLTAIGGITNINDKEPRLPTLLNFLHHSEIPNLRELTGIGIESGMDLKVFERFRNLSSLELDSVFTGNLELNVGKTRLVTLNNLRSFKISGNSISLSDLNFPKLFSFEIHITGSTERNFRSTIHLENIRIRKLRQLRIVSSNISDAPNYILQHLDTSSLLDLSILSSNLSSFPPLAKMHFPKLLRLKLGGYYVSSDEMGFLPDPLYINAPNLEILDVKSLQNYNQALFGGNISYKGLKRLQLHIRVLPEPQNYKFTKENYPDLEDLEIDYFNKFGRLISNNINLYLDLPNLKTLKTKQEVLDKIDSTNNLKDGNIKLQILKSDRGP